MTTAVDKRPAAARLVAVAAAGHSDPLLLHHLKGHDRGEPGEVPFHGQVTSENLPITMNAPAEAQPAPHTSSPGRTMAIGRRRSYAKTTSRTELERVFTSNGDAALRRSELESPESDQIIAVQRVTIEQQDATFRNLRTRLDREADEHRT
jgi:hypothetical protein